MTDKTGKILTVSGYVFCILLACALVAYSLQPAASKTRLNTAETQAVPNAAELISKELEIDSTPAPSQETKGPPVLLSELHPYLYGPNRPKAATPTPTPSYDPGIDMPATLPFQTPGENGPAKAKTGCGCKIHEPPAPANGNPPNP